MIRLVIASLLKPIDEVRMYKRIGISLAKTNKYEVNIIGIESKNKIPDLPNINFHMLPRRGRSFSNRLQNLIAFQRMIKELQPMLLIVTGPELLLFSVNYGRSLGHKTIYDLQEDYHKNIIYQRVYPSLLRPLLAYAVRQVETLMTKKIDSIFLAEKIYQTEIPFCENNAKTVLLENKYAGIDHSTIRSNRTPTSLLFTGTLSDYSGVMNAVQVYEALRKSKLQVELKIVGICHDHQLAKHLRLLAKKDPNFVLVGLDEFVNHEVITSNILSADIGIIGYEPNEINEKKIPSKLYEYMALQLPTIVQRDTLWCEELTLSKLAIPVQFDEINGLEIIEKYQSLIKNDFKSSNHRAYWDTEEPKLLDMISTLLST